MSLDIGLFESYWHLIGHRLELPEPGDYVRFDTPIGEVVVCNDQGDLLAFDNLCPHRGARIFSEDAGTQGFSCRYHGWSFRSGQIHVPDPHNYQSCDLASAKLNTYLLDWCGDFVFVAIKPLSTLNDQLGTLTETLENISFNINARVDLNRYEFECYWPIAVENALEPYHIPLIHTETLATLQLENGINVFDGCNSVWHAPIGHKRIHKQLVGFKKLFNIDFQQEEYLSIFLFPFGMLSSTFGYSYSLQNFFPSETAEKTNFTSRLYSVNSASENATKIIDPFIKSTQAVNRRVFDEDHEICKLVPARSWSPSPLEFASQQEEKIVHFRNECSQFLTKRSRSDNS